MDRDDVELADFAWASGVAGLDEPLTGAPKPKKGHPCHFGRPNRRSRRHWDLKIFHWSLFCVLSCLCVWVCAVGVCRGCVPWAQCSSVGGHTDSAIVSWIFVNMCPIPDCALALIVHGSCDYSSTVVVVVVVVVVLCCTVSRMTNRTHNAKRIAAKWTHRGSSLWALACRPSGSRPARCSSTWTRPCSATSCRVRCCHRRRPRILTLLVVDVVVVVVTVVAQIEANAPASSPEESPVNEAALEAFVTDKLKLDHILLFFAGVLTLFRAAVRQPAIKANILKEDLKELKLSPEFAADFIKAVDGR